jgi:putative DNA methylase
MALAAKVRKKLIEVSIPLEVINRESAREKSIRHGHPSTLHLWWARRPLAACRAVLFAQLVDDPSACPEEFPTVELQKAERDRLHNLIERLVPWEASNNEMILTDARYEIARSLARARGETLPPLTQMKPQAIIDYLQTNAPPIYDPFSGGGSIPLEAQRLGLKAMGSDLNPVAVLIGKALIEFPPKFSGRKPVNPEVNELHQWKGAQGLADDVRYYGRWMRGEAEKKIGQLYPKVRLKDGSDARVIAWLWARTVPSPDPRANGAHVPLVSSFLLSARPGQEAVIKPVVDHVKMTWTFEVDDNPTEADIEIARQGTKHGNGFRCLLTGAPMSFAALRAYGRTSRFGTRLLAIVAERKGGRTFVAANAQHEKLALEAKSAWRPDQSLEGKALGFRVPEYGLTTWGDLFSERQLVALTTFTDLVAVTRDKVLLDARAHWSAEDRNDQRRLSDGGSGPDAYADAVATYLAFTIDRMADLQNTLCPWRNDPAKLHVGHLFSRQAISMLWDYAEANVFGSSAGSWLKCEPFVPKCLDALPAISAGAISMRDAAELQHTTAMVFSTDPPYYDNIGYADLSDFFYVWLRRALGSIHPDLFRRVLTPKTEELVAAPHRHSDKGSAEEFFLNRMKKALGNIANVSEGVPTTIFYAFKQSEIAEDGVTSAGWASFLQAAIDSGLAVDGTWPMRSELANRTRGQASNALASSIVLVCGHRDVGAPTITRADFLRVLRREMPAALAEIRRAGVGPTDIQQAAIGPGIGIFTRHANVLNTDGTLMLVRDALKLVNQVREEITSTGDTDYDSETRFALDWFAAKGFDKGKSGDAIVMTNAVDVSLDGMNAAGVFEARGGDARLLKREELPNNWNPTADNRATVWEACQHLIKRLTAEDGGIDAAADLYNRLGGLAEPAHALARRLYDICEQKQWASEGRVYNHLHQEWAVIEKRAAELAETRADLFSR